MIRIKICGVTTPEDVRMVADAGADAIGLNFYVKSPRYVDPKSALDLIRALPPFVAPVGVFVDTPFNRAVALAFQLGLRGVQTYAAPPDEDAFPFAHLPAFRVKDAASLLAIRQYVDGAASFGRRPAAVLVDSYVAGEMGGTGHSAPWELLVGFDPGVPLILAGGLTPDNIAEAIQLVQPWGIDVASGVEYSPGKKDVGKVRAFVKNARIAAQL
jgi:phosphoribosylanthranilate isomerase